MYQYRCFIKDGLNLGGMPIANAVCLSFTLNKDLLSTATSNFELLVMPTNIKNGDVLGLVDPYGTVIFNGVINSIGDTITCRDITALFDDEWKWHDPGNSTIEQKLKSIITSDFKNSSDPMIADRFPFTITASSSTTGTWTAQDTNYVVNFQSLLYEMYNTYGVITDIQVPFSGTPTITLKQATHPSVKIGNNTLVVQNMTPLTEIFELNKLVIYNSDGTTLRGTYYTTTSGITTNENSPLRPSVVKTKYIFNTDDDLADIAQENLQEEIYNHKVEFDLILNNALYDFFDWELGMPIEIWHNGMYFSTIFTKYSISKAQNEDVYMVSVLCGKVRNTLTEKLNAARDEQTMSMYTGDVV